MIFDSAPAYPSRARVAAAAATQPLRLRLLSAASHVLAAVLGLLRYGALPADLFWCALAGGGGPAPPRSSAAPLPAPHHPRQQPLCRRDMERLTLGRRTLYLYSRDNPLCDARNLEALVAARRAAGADVMTRAWATGRHCRLWEDHPAEWRAEVRAFLETLGGGGAGAGAGRS